MQNKHGWHAFPRTPRTHSRRQRHCGRHRFVSAAEKSRANFTALYARSTRKRPPASTSIRINKFSTASGCHKGGDVFTFVKEYETSLRWMPSAGWPERAKIPWNSTRTRRTANRASQGPVAPNPRANCATWQNCLLNEAAGQAARDYLAKRGVSPEAVKLFRLGAAPMPGTTLFNWAKSKGHRSRSRRKGRGSLLKKRKAEIQKTENETRGGNPQSAIHNP